MRVAIERVSARLRTSFVSATGSIERRDLLLLSLAGRDGHVGLGEAAPLPDYDGVQLDDCLAALEDCRGALADGDDREPAELLADCWRLAVLPQAVAAVDLALWDLAGKRAGEPVWRLLGAEDAAAVQVNHTVGSPDRAGAAAEASRAREAGYATLKLKVGTGDDPGRVAAVRAAAGPEMALRLDANGAWSVGEADRMLRALAPAGIELCEEPVHGLDQMAELSRVTDVRLALDESSAAPGALDRRVCDAVCLKIGRCGGITAVIEAAHRARRAGYEVYLASTLDGPLGLAAALHAAAVIGPDRPCGLATLGLFTHGIDSLQPRHGRLRPPRGPGLGDGLVSWYAT